MVGRSIDASFGCCSEGYTVGVIAASTHPFLAFVIHFYLYSGIETSSLDRSGQEM